jgi:hypothetical protein
MASTAEEGRLDWNKREKKFMTPSLAADDCGSLDQEAQSRTILPELPDFISSKPSWKSV